MNIGQFSKKAGWTASAVRFYETKGFFDRSRSPNGYRVYGEADLIEAQLISFGKSMGFSLREILEFTKEMRGGKIDHHKIQKKLNEKVGHIENQIRDLRKARRMILARIEQCKAAEALRA